MNRWGSKQISASGARTQLRMLLVNCTDAALADKTPEGLARTHRVPLAECKYLLAMERQKRGAVG